jgi:hypothetical protein
LPGQSLQLGKPMSWRRRFSHSSCTIIFLCGFDVHARRPITEKPLTDWVLVLHYTKVPAHWRPGFDPRQRQPLYISWVCLGVDVAFICAYIASSFAKHPFGEHFFSTSSQIQTNFSIVVLSSKLWPAVYTDVSINYSQLCKPT